MAQSYWALSAAGAWRKQCHCPTREGEPKVRREGNILLRLPPALAGMPLTHVPSLSARLSLTSWLPLPGWLCPPVYDSPAPHRMHAFAHRQSHAHSWPGSPQSSTQSSTPVDNPPPPLVIPLCDTATFGLRAEIVYGRDIQSIVINDPLVIPSQMGLDRGPPPPGTATPWGRCHLDGAALPLPDQVEEIGVTSHGLQESLASEQRGGGQIQFLLGVPLSTSGQEPGVSAPKRATLYVWDVPSGLSMVLTVTSGLVDLCVNPPGCPEWPGAGGCTLEENVASGSPSQVSPPKG